MPPIHSYPKSKIYNSSSFRTFYAKLGTIKYFSYTNLYAFPEIPFSMLYSYIVPLSIHPNTCVSNLVQLSTVLTISTYFQKHFPKLDSLAIMLPLSVHIIPILTKYSQI